jgi:hypothetical protein
MRKRVGLEERFVSFNELGGSLYVNENMALMI